MNKSLSQINLAISLACLLSIGPAYSEDVLLKGTATKQNIGTSPKDSEKAVTKPSSSFIEKYGEAARSPKVEAAIKSKDNLTKEQQARKAASDRFEAEMKGLWVPGSSPTTAIMYGYVPPNMPPAQAIMMSQMLPRIPRMAQPMSPEMVSRMAGEPPMMPFEPLSAHQRGIPMQRIPQAGFDLRGTPNIQALMGSGGMTGGLTRAEIAAQNQRMAEEALRARYGPVYVPQLQRGPGHGPVQQKKTALSAEHQGSIVGVTDSLGNEVTSIQYDPWGNSTLLAGSTMPDFGFQGMYYHARSGKYLTLYRAYDPKLGRWLSRDPLGESAGTNLYSFVGNNPISYFDPLGLDALYGYGGIGGLHRGLFIVRDNGQIVTINGGYSGRGLKSFTGRLTLNIRDDQKRPTSNLWSPVDATPITTNQCKIDTLFENAKQLQNRLLPENRPVPYSVFVPSANNEGRTSNQVIPLLLRSSGIPVPDQPFSPGYDIPFGDTTPGLN